MKVIRHLPLVLLAALLLLGGCIKEERRGYEEGSKEGHGDIGLQRFTDIGGDFELIDQNNKPFKLSSLKGKAVILFFGYLTCPDVCPTTLMELKQLREDLGRDAERMQVLFVSVDPERDTPEKLKDYLTNFDPAFLGLTGTPEVIAKVAQQYKVAYSRREQRSSMGYTVDHSAASYLVDTKGELRYIFAFKTKIPFMVKGVKKVLEYPEA
ncbi:MAG: hypothetical protein A2527_04970 [Candidatus Lambdaproteobacteria bacterium RIFOXYD2_FULL_50_16]|uniref:Thioredoxin domain-containing protein n=1 Tax=Candidatus Lambdaproteobacteria bacterium RIFOXYD2_FULL_50_16 TaxID=1817772 RepID=A0A1F6G817_9PROT|nr:MAG: hypothetical protein A2527_04970 [Candidatus Lambdaproteobacteria bacterium RIFOXYD2_FULL_50_16]